MKFVSTTGEDIHITLTSGHTALVGTEPVELDVKFHKEAIARGALPAGLPVEVQEAQKPAFDRKEAITNTLNDMLDGGAEGDFNNDGRPSLAKVNGRLGFTASREEVDAVWAEISKSE